LWLREFDSKPVLGSVELNTQSVQPGSHIEGDFIAEGATLKTAERRLNAVPLEKFFA
jgi:hypothetical protein